MIRVLLESLVKRFGKVEALAGATLDVRPGELTVLLGPSEAGKSTLARLIVGLDTPDEGEIYFDGKVIHDQPAGGRKVGYLPQGCGLWPHLSVAENVGYGLKIKGVGRRDRKSRVADVLSAIGIDSLADRRPLTLSDLQGRQTALARALSIEPNLLLLDEPFAGLDGRARVEFRETVRRIASEMSVTTLILTADAGDALALADRLAVMDFGKVVQVGTSTELYNRPANLFVARILGPTNQFQGQVESVDGRGDVVIRTPLGRLIGRCPAGTPTVGLPVTLLIRPESLGLGPVPIGSNRFAATVERLVFLGETREIRLRGPGDWPIVVKSLQSQSNGLREGQSLSVSVAPEAVVILPGKYAS